ncbi:uncharacterized protein PV09_04552 [Verruconis gallopava]|uniref:Cep57 centrosome microtubule-binding domain-containing protein n=1 Tax=Verruconis gallopava TaxID=253628 RepID=A0A0D1YU88_9PEZI|nr:uncharacterized protein PV09_04552 [Verruconis gallopava]KIW04247.1 hypothetical protein PV09_04552 [Verruconis gallopava]
MSDTERSTSARAIHALAASRRRSRASPAPSIASSDDVSTFNPDNDDALMSTKHHIDEDDSHFLPKIRTTAQQRRYYNPELPPQVPTSAVRREFGDFDHSNSTDDEENSIEVGRGIGNTPSKPNKSLDSEILLEIGNSHYEFKGTPPSRSRPTPKSNLRKEAQLRRASSTRVPTNTRSTKENVMAQHDNQDARSRPTRFASRTVSANNDTYQRPLAGTPQRANGTPRGVANSTVQSFLLPEMPNLTELFGGSIKGTPMLSRGLPNRRVTPANPGPGNYIPVSSVPIPEEEKAILHSLQILKERLEQVEQEKAEADHRIEEYEIQVSELQAQLDAHASLRRSDSALGSSDGEAVGSSKNKWKIEKAQLESSVQSLKRRLEHAERKVSTAEANTKRAREERDSLGTQLSVAYYSNEELKGENEVLQNENRLLQDQVAELQAENRALAAEIEELRMQLDLSHERHEDETTRWQKKEAALTRKANTNDRAILNENQTLRDELVRAREQQEAAERKAAQREEKARREAERAAEVEHAKLTEEKEQLLAELEQAKESREAELKRWASKQAELQAHIDQRDETIHQLRVAVPQEEINEELRKENQNLKAELARLKATARNEESGTPKETLRRRLEEVMNQHAEATEQWKRKETRLRDRLEHVKQVNDLYREIDATRDGETTRNVAESKGKRRSTGQITSSVHEALHQQTTRDYPRTRSRSKSQSRRITRSETSRRHRHVSAPVSVAAHDESESSEKSDSDMSFDPAILAGAPKSGAKGKRATGFVPVHTGDTTYLSYIDGDEIAKLRKRLEEEHLAARQRKSTTVPQSSPDEEVTGYGIRRRSSQKDLTARSRASSRARSVLSITANEDSAVEDATTGLRNEDTVHSHVSHASRISHRRRRSSAAFTEMTSAFIIPDITLHTQRDATTQDVLKSVSADHDIKNCSVCQRILSTSPVDIDELNIPAPVPVSERKEYNTDVDATMRPSQPPSQALSRVIKELSDELHHLKLEFVVLTQKLKNADPALGKRAHNTLHKKIERLNNAIKVKGGQLYALYDVCEAHKIEIGRSCDENAGELPEDVEKTLESIRAAREKKVDFGTAEGEESESEWPGISDTEGL